METVDSDRVQSVFLLALEATDLAARERILVRECGATPELRKRVDELLRAHEKSGSFLDQPVVRAATGGQSFSVEPSPGDDADMAPSTSAPPPMVAAGALVGERYRLIELIGEGGMGEVWMAEQREPVKRLVALKLIKPGLGSKTVLARFEAERQALALMDHVHIAKIYDGGTSRDGRPYFVMELVKGLPITRYCDERRLTIRDRIKLFGRICQAVQHAHQKGIIHRDLKPTNILVTEYDGEPVPKVIDFGLAKALQGQFSLTDHTLYTFFGAAVGTPLYMAPEQVAINSLDVDTRTDVYALGVILYELLTGSTPLERQQFYEAAWDEVCRLIREVEAPRPSLRLSSSDALPSIAAQRSVEPMQLSRAVCGELDWIVMKSLDKERSRRYETADAMARDLERYLRDEAVEACPPSAAYRLKKLLRRNKGLVTALAAVFLALVAGMIGTTLGLVEARRQEGVAVVAAGKEMQARKAESQRAEAEVVQRRRAEAAESLANDRLKQAIIEKNHADQAAAIAAAVNEFVSNDILGQADSLAQADGGHAPTHDLTVRTAIDRAAEKVGRAFADRPLVEAQVRRTIGDVYLGLGEHEKAAEHLERAAELLRAHLDADDPWTQSTYASLITAYNQSGRVDEAIALSEQVYEDCLRRLGAEHSQTQLIGNNLAMAYHAAGNLDKAIELLESARDVSLKMHGAIHPTTLSYSANLAAAMCDAGRIAEAIPLFEQVRADFVKTFGADHPQTLKCTLSLAIRYLRLHRTDECIKLLEPARQPTLTQLGMDHPQYLLLLETLAGAYLDQGVTDKAIPSRVRLKEIAELLVQLYTKRGETSKSDQWRQTLLELHGPGSELATPPAAE